MAINASSMSIICAKHTSILEVYKPIMTPTVPGVLSPSLTELVINQFPEQRGIEGFHPNEGGLLYRLDNETSGLVLFATDQATFDQFQQDSQNQRIKKHYIAYVEGILPNYSGIIEYQIANHTRTKKKMVVQKEHNQQKRGEWRHAQTFFQVISTDQAGRSWIHLMIYQGARHQIRVHCAAIGHPLVGDSLYNAKASNTQPFQLRCQAIEWTNKKMTFSLTDLALTAEEKREFPVLPSLTIG